MTFKQFEKLFKAVYPNAILWKEKKNINITFDENSKSYTYKNYTLHDLALQFNLISQQEYNDIKKKMGYISYQ